MAPLHLRAAAVVAMAVASAGIPPEKMKESGQRAAKALQQELEVGKELLAQLHKVAEQGGFHNAEGKLRGFPDLHKDLEHRMAGIVSDARRSGGGVYSAYVATDAGEMHGIVEIDNRPHAWIGVAPTDPQLHCTDPTRRATCKYPEGRAGDGFLQTYEVQEEADRYQLGGLHQNASFDPRVHEWFQPNRQGLHVQGPYLFKPDTLSSAMGLTFSQAVFRNNKFVGVVGVDIDLSYLDFVLGPLRPASGAEAVIADPDGFVIVSTMPASRQVRWTHKPVSCFDAPFLQIFGHIVNTAGNLHRAIQAGPILLHANEESKLLRWNSIFSVPIHVGPGKNWLLVVTDDSENRHEAAGIAAPSLAVTLLLALALLL